MVSIINLLSTIITIHSNFFKVTGVIAWYDKCLNNSCFGSYQVELMSRACKSYVYFHIGLCSLIQDAVVTCMFKIAFNDVYI